MPKMVVSRFTVGFSDELNSSTSDNDEDEDHANLIILYVLGFNL